MLASLAPYLPYLLPLLYLVLNEAILHSKLESGSLLQLAATAIMNGLKGMIGANPPQPLP